uniref:PPM-type phosphatase domain-containing protein n=1 Tax=Fagus sylvatica TaxID=28930 RepID=A0A2N9EYD9_FAGSY
MAYEKTDQAILSHSSDLGRGGSTAVTAILINSQKLFVANVGDSRAVLSRGGQAIQMSTDHEPNTERGSIENKGGFVSNMPGLLDEVAQTEWMSFFAIKKTKTRKFPTIHTKGDDSNVIVWNSCSLVEVLQSLGFVIYVVLSLLGDPLSCINHDLCHTFLSGDVPRVNGQLAVSRAFGDKSLKSHLRSDPDIQDTIIDAHTEVLILASDGLWKVISNQEAVDIARRIKDPKKAAKQLIADALKRDSKDDISCVVVRFRG